MASGCSGSLVDAALALLKILPLIGGGDHLVLGLQRRSGAAEEQ